MRIGLPDNLSALITILSNDTFNDVLESAVVDVPEESDEAVAAFLQRQLEN